MLSPDPGSFRDPASRVFVEDDRVIRALDNRGVEAWKHLASSDFFSKAVESGQLIESVELPDHVGPQSGAIQHPRLPLITYPYEWTFSMLKDAALLQLDLLADALPEGVTMKDATPFNIQFVRGRPIFIDVGSFEPYRNGEPWIGYRQFTRQFLFPLMLRAWLDIPHQVWLRGDMEGPTAAQMKVLLPRSKRMKPAVMMHVSLQASMEDRLSGKAVRGDLAEAGFSADLILANVRKLHSLVESLEWEPEAEGWSDYRSCTHVGRDRDTKSQFLKSILLKHSPSIFADFGANDGHFSAIAAEAGSLAVAIDGDEPVLDDLYRSIGGRNLAVVVSDLTNPSPGQGWAGNERRALFDRVQPDLIIAYGVIHHLVYTASIPPAEVLRWLRSFDAVVALEFVGPADAMVGQLTANKLESELHVGRSEDEFRALLEGMFEIGAEQALEGGTRVLFELVPR
ncbi:MAG: methyltransferase [Deltaproteobacteria bacterium]|nr:methyltransferase [Deltaproteobacteria bacterium]